MSIDPEIPHESDDALATQVPQVDDVLSSLAGTLALLRRSVGYGEGMAMAMDPDALIPTQFVATYPINPEIARLGCRNEQQDQDYNQFRELAVSPSPVATLSIDHDPECQQSNRWQQLLLPRGRRHELRAAMVDAEGVCWGALALYRREGTRFSPSDVATVRRLAQSRASHLARSMFASRAPGTPESPTSILLDESGSIVGATDSARSWLDDFRRSDSLDRVGMILTSLAARLRLLREKDTNEGGTHVRMRSWGGSWTTFLAESLGGSGLGLAIPVIVMATESAQLLSLQVAAFELSDREAEVVAHVLAGLDTKTIALRLSISVLTVQDHLKSIFEKTKTHSRRELTYLLGRNPGTRGRIGAV
ncbi:MAG TPA: helix-turn-helix transcriptional regulator, partial [Acidimicrobiales bacterium]|nr:helix-turn-helix transcriptional regulator [Acidimicrobiales bacterium]